MKLYQGPTVKQRNIQHLPVTSILQHVVQVFVETKGLWMLTNWWHWLCHVPCRDNGGRRGLFPKLPPDTRKWRHSSKSKAPVTPARSTTQGKPRSIQQQPAGRGNSSSWLAALSAVYLEGMVAEKLHILPSAAGRLVPNESGDQGIPTFAGDKGGNNLPEATWAKILSTSLCLGQQQFKNIRSTKGCWRGEREGTRRCVSSS